MKSKTSIFVMALAVLMLVAFTACEQPTIKYPADVSYITIQQTGDFLVGDKFDASKFAVYAHDTNGGSTLIQGANVTCDELKDSAPVAADKTYTATAKLSVSSNEKGELTASCEFVGYEVESVQITGAPELVVYKATGAASGTAVVKADGTADSASDYADASYTLVYNGGSTREVSYKDFGKYVAFEALVTQNVTEVAVGTEYPVWIRTSSDDYVATNLKATGVAEAPKPVTPAKTFTGYSLIFTSKNWIGEDYAWTLYENYSTGSPVAVATSENWADTTSDNYIIMSADDGDGDAKTELKDVPEKYTQYDQTVTILDKNDPSKKQYEMKFPKGNNSISKEVTSSDVVFYDIASDKVTDKLTKANIKIKVTNLLNTSADGQSQEYMKDANYSILQQKVDETNWYGVIEVNYSVKDKAVREAFEVTLQKSTASELPDET